MTETMAKYDAVTWKPCTVALSDLTPWEHNPKSISKSHAKRLLEYWQRIGQFQTVAIGPDGEVYDGHQRLAVLRSALGDKYQVQALRASRPLTDDERRELVIAAHTGTVGQWDWDALSGWDATQMQAWGMDQETLKEWKADAGALTDLLESAKPQADAEPQIDRAAELLEKWQVKTGDLWRIGDHRLLCGDSTKREDVERVMQGENAQMVWTDPPYGVHYGEKPHPSWRQRQIENDDLPADQLESFLRSALCNAAEYSNPGAAIYVASPAGTLLPSLIAAFDGSGFDYHWGLIWLKDQIVLSRADYHFKHENILYGWKPGASHYFTADRTQSSVFEYPRPKRSDEHPTMKPVALIQHMITNSSQSDGCVLDLFIGSGSTMVACQNLSRKCRAIEISPAYCAVTLERMATAFPGIEIELLGTQVEQE